MVSPVPPDKRGVSRTSRHVRWDAMDVSVPKDERHLAYGEAVWSRRPDAGVKVATMQTHRAVDGGNQALVHRGERGVSRQTIAQGRPGISAVACGLRAFAQSFLREGPRVPAGARPSLRPLQFLEGETAANLGRDAPRGRYRMFSRCHAPRKRGIQYAAALRGHTTVSGILDRPPARAMTTWVRGTGPHMAVP